MKTQKTPQKLRQRQTKQKQTLARATMSTILILWLISCTTSRINSPAPKVTPPDPYNEAGELIIKYIPIGAQFTADEDGVFFPYWYFEKIFDYIVDTQAAQDIASGKQ
ncbi:MAG: hypothetical protein MJZ72_09795 [Bacteroidales bacterium]|nr:hypothetical protein [Bacteroidales bacterium]